MLCFVSVVFLNWLFSLLVFVLSAPLARTVTHTCKVKCSQRRLRVALRPALLPSSAASSPSPSIPLFIHRFNRPHPFIHVAIFFVFISLPQVSASLSSRVPPLSPELHDLDIPRCCCRIGDWILASFSCLCSVCTCAVLTRRRCRQRVRRRLSAEGLHAGL